MSCETTELTGPHHQNQHDPVANQPKRQQKEDLPKPQIKLWWKQEKYSGLSRSYVHQRPRGKAVLCRRLPIFSLQPSAFPLVEETQGRFLWWLLLSWWTVALTTVLMLRNARNTWTFRIKERAHAQIDTLERKHGVFYSLIHFGFDNYGMSLPKRFRRIWMDSSIWLDPATKTNGLDTTFQTNWSTNPVNPVNNGRRIYRSHNHCIGRYLLFTVHVGRKLF